jgi:hypothetical protein
MDWYSKLGLTIGALAGLVVVALGSAVFFGLRSDAGMPPCVPATQEAASGMFILGIYVIDALAVLGSALGYWLALQLQWLLGQGRLRSLLCWALSLLIAVAVFVLFYEMASLCMQQALWQGEGIGLPELSSNYYVEDFWIGRVIDLALLSALGVAVSDYLRRRSLNSRAPNRSMQHE